MARLRRGIAECISSARRRLRLSAGLVYSCRFHCSAIVAGDGEPRAVMETHRFSPRGRRCAFPSLRNAFNALLQIIYSGAAFSEFGLDYVLKRLWQLLEHAPEVSGAIVAVWVVLALTGAGRKPSNWLEILRLIFGVLWVVWYFVHYWMFFADLPWLKGEAFTW